MKYPFPNDEYEFEDFCISVLKKLWNTEQVDRFGRRGQAQHGVDILDFSGATELRAAQCKHRKLGSLLTNDEIAVEVNRAKAFPQPIHKYFFLTTAERSTAIDLEVLNANRRLANEGLFSLTYLPWDAIERLVDEYPDLQNRLLTPPALITLSIQKNNQLLISEITAQLTFIASAASSLVDAELNDADQSLSAGDYSLARLLLTRVRTNQWDHCRPYQRFRVLTMLARSLFHEDRQEEAGRMLIQAADEDPTNTKAAAILAQGQELTGQTEQAFATATLALKGNSSNSKAAAIMIRTMPSAAPWATLLAQVPQAAIDGEVSAALALRATDSGDFSLALSHARFATTEIPDWPVAWLLLGDILFKSEIQKLVDLTLSDRRRDESVLLEAIDALTKAIGLARSPGLRDTYVEALTIRSKAYDMLGERAASADDVRAAFNLAPRRPDVLWIKAHLLESTGDLPGAIDCLRQAVAVGADSVARHVLAAFLSRTGVKELKQEALAIWLELSVTAGVQYRNDARILALRGLIELGDLERAREFVDRLDYGDAGESFKDAVLARLAIADGDVASAEQYALRSAASLRGDDPIETVRVTADLLTELGKYSEALPILGRLFAPGIYSRELHNYIAVAERLGRFDLVMRVCRETREAGAGSDELFQQEVGLLERYDPPAAISLLTKRIAEDNNDKLARLHLSIIGLRLDRRDLISADINDLPPSASIDPIFSGYVVKVIQTAGNATDAVIFAYRVLRRNFGSSNAHRAFIQSLSPLAQPPIEAHQNIVQIGSAIRYEESGSERWIILEDDEVPDIGRDEYGPDSKLAKRFIGAAVGDSIPLIDVSFQPRIADIREIVPKYVYRYRDCLENWQVRFPDESFVQRVVLSEHDKEDPLRLVQELARRRRDSTEQVFSDYLTSPMSIHVLAERLSTDEISAVFSLAWSPDHALRTFAGNAAAYESYSTAAIRDVDVAAQIVVDISAISTLILLGEEDVARRNGPLVTGQGVWDQVMNWSLVDMHESLSVGVEGNTLSATQLSAETKSQIRAAREASRLSLFAGITFTAAIGLASLTASLRDTLEQIFGTAGSEAMSIAGVPGAILWTDEYLLALFAQKELGVRVISSELILRHWRDQGKMTSDAYTTACAKLISWGYTAIPVNAEVLFSAGQCAEWQPDRFPFAACLDVISSDAFDTPAVIGLMLRLLPRVSRALTLPESQMSVLNAISQRLGNRPDRTQVYPQLLRHIDRAYGLDQGGAKVAREVLTRTQGASGD